MKRKNPKKEAIPTSVLEGTVSKENFDQRALWYGTNIKQWGVNWPFLSNDPDTPGTADVRAWDIYFRTHLGGDPPVYKLFRAKIIRYMNLPEKKPEVFDISYHPNPEAKPMDEWEVRPEGRFHKLELCNLFVPVGCPGYREMVQAKKEGLINHYRVDNERLGIHVNVRDYYRIMGKGSGVGA